jgi:hypothetical protein
VDKARGWLGEFGASTFGAWDFKVGAIVGVVSVALASAHAVRDAATTVLLTSAGVDVAVTATILAALTIFTTLFDSSYRLILEAAGGFRKALMPYTTVACVAALAALVALLASLAAPDLGQWPGALAIGVSMLLTAWALAGTASLVELTHFHADQRARLLKGADDAEQIRAARLSAPRH